jgi:hypothetical protein
VSLRELCSRLLPVLLAGSLAGCVSVAKLEDLPKQATDVRFDEISKRAVRKDDLWNLQTDYEYFMVLGGTTDAQLHAALEKGFKEAHYEVVKSDREGRAVTGERGLTLAEWGSVIGAYYRMHEGRHQVYFRSLITQDVTGSWHENRAKSVAEAVCGQLSTCRAK